MNVENVADLLAVDRRVRLASESFERATAALESLRAEQREGYSGDAFGALRDVTGQSMYRALTGLAPSVVDIAHRDALVRWVHELLQARIAWDLSIDESNARHARDPNLSRAVRDRSATDAGDEVHTPARSFEEARLRVVLSSHPVPRQEALVRLAELAPPVVAARSEIRSRRFEAARRLGLSHPWSLAVTPADTPALETIARAVLDATEPLATELFRALRKGSDGAIGLPTLAIGEGFAPEAREGWPARLTTRWLEESFKAIAGRPPRGVTLPAALGGASFLRAASAWGQALRLGAVPRTLPFAMARDPYAAEAFSFGQAIAGAVASAAFARRHLGLVSRLADAHTRSLGRVRLTTLRRVAAMVVVGGRESLSTDEAEVWSARVFGAPLPRPLPMLWASGGFSGAARLDAPGRLLGALLGARLEDTLVDRFDEDWFDNPRAGAHLASIGAGPVFRGAEGDDAGTVTRLARSFEETLG